MAHLVQDDVPILFQGGTALHVKLGDRTRFSIDVDVRCPEPAKVEKSLARLPKRFPHSGITIREPPQPLWVDGVRHTILFPNAAEANGEPVRILVEVVPSEGAGPDVEPLPLKVDDLDWHSAVAAPSLEWFAAQKFAVLGPETIGKPVGPNEQFARQNQGVCKQIHDLGQLMRYPLNGNAIRNLYAFEVDEANRLRGTEFTIESTIADAARLIGHLREPEPRSQDPIAAYALWSGFRDSRRWVRDRENWTPGRYRTIGGLLNRMATELRSGKLRWDLIARPLRDAIPAEDLVANLDHAVNEPAPWVARDRFAGDVQLAWAWSPPEYW